MLADFSSISLEYGVMLGILSLLALWFLFKKTRHTLPPMSPPSMLQNMKRSGYPSLPHKVEMSEW